MPNGADRAEQLIEAIRVSYELAREGLEIGNSAVAYSSLKRLKEQAEALYELHRHLICEQLLILEPLARRLEETLTRLGCGWGPAGAQDSPGTRPEVGPGGDPAPP